ncbi:MULTISPECIES: hypothetical protein [unclassified Leifsonia]|uniref:hypothetical protein n=1 Tax=unclassified Leifsonia TaxID=2663824 RepID=UPI0012F8D4CA|nr:MULTISPECIES: hypothetical protein [unclassified Leifsonia]
MADEQDRSLRTYTTLFVIVGVIMLVLGVLNLVTSDDNALLSWVIIACGVFNIGLAVLFHRRRR